MRGSRGPEAPGGASLTAWKTKSLWLREALEGWPGRPRELTEPVKADVCIVGGGYTGLWTALRIQELDPSADVALVEANLCGAGASGRNGGFVLSWWSKFVTLQKLCGTEEATRLGRAAQDAVAAIGGFCRDHGIDAGYRGDGWLWAAVNRAQMGSWTPTVEALRRAGVEPFEELGPREAAGRSGSSAHLGGVFEASAAIVQPARLALGLRGVALERGVRIYERSPMIGVHRARGGGDSGWTVDTTGGSVSAGSVALAMNAWAVRFRQIRRHILVVGSDIVATQPAPDQLAEVGWTEGLCISDSRLLVHYYRTTADGRIAFGKGGGELAFGGRVGRRFDGSSPRRRVVEQAFRATYPDLREVAVADSWTGPVDRSKTGVPLFGQLPGHPGVFFAVGYSGNGVGPSYIGGRILASLALRRRDEWQGCGLVAPPSGRFPPEPIRFLGGSMVRSAIERTERAEDQGRRPRAVDARLVRLAPGGLVPVRRGG
jgi:putative aminophosphonate oxidoreductase